MIDGNVSDYSTLVAMEVERHQSPDGVLRLVVRRDGRDLVVGFEGASSHTHGDVLVGEYEGIGERRSAPEAAVRRYGSDSLADRMKIRIYRRGDSVRDVSALPYETGDESKHLAPGESVEARYWSGASVGD